MPDLTIEIYPMCSQMERYERADCGYYQEYFRGQWHCTCPGFKFRKTCKHVKVAESVRCTWHGAYDEPQEKEGECPHCGGPTVYVQVGV
jgi:hypothetical protein